MKYSRSPPDLTSLVLETVCRPGTVSVFPSEITAAFWRDAVLAYTDARSIESDRFLSWDTFKERVLSHKDPARRPVNTAGRLLAARELLFHNSTESYIRFFIPQEYAGESSGFDTWLSRILPTLGRLRSSLSAASGTAERDLAEITSRYRMYLDRYGLFEPGWIEPGPAEDGLEYHLFLAEVIEDIKEFENTLQRTPGIHLVTSPAYAVPEVTVYHSTTAEIRAVLRRIEALLDSGTAQSSIAITAGEIEETAPALLEEARRREIPLILRHGTALSRSGPGRFFGMIEKTAASGYGIRLLSELLTEPGLRWKDSGTIGRVVRFGLDHGCIGDPGKRTEGRWLRSLAASDQNDIEGWYRTFTAAVGNVRKASTFPDLRASVYRLSTIFLETDDWEPENQRVFQRCLDLLSDLADWSDSTGVPVHQPWTAYLRLLDTSLYVPKNRHQGIPVYGYPVSAGIYPEYHFIINAGDRATHRESRVYAFLREQDRESLGVSIRDLSEPFVRAYSASGREVSVSCSRNTRTGAQLPPPSAVMAGTEREAPALPHDRPVDLIRHEQWYLDGSLREPPGRLYIGLQKGLHRMLQTGLAEKGLDCTVQAVNDTGIVEALEARINDPDGYFRISPSSLGSFRNCGMAYLLEHLLEIREKRYEVLYEDSMTIGSLYHLVLERVFVSLRKDEIIRQDLEDRLSRTLESEIIRVFEVHGALNTPIPDPVIPGLAAQAVSRLSEFLAEELRQREGCSLESTEATFTFRDESGRIEYRGRLDRVLRDPRTGTVIVTDYKNNTVPKKSAVLGNLESDPIEPPSVFQIPFYVLLLEQQGARVSEAGYYSIAMRRNVRVFQDGNTRAWMDRAGLERLVRETRIYAGRARDAIRLGQYFLPGDGCSGCSHRSVCRTSFYVR